MTVGTQLQRGLTISRRLNQAYLADFQLKTSKKTNEDAGMAERYVFVGTTVKSSASEQVN
ncbi:hypothetical protein [Novosphingobium sp. KN65.2]|uniref:hypothetical protein n=1 Tax=Novosphingobium sp. KN65.2 TaxID=1478134 RepID=UPI0012E1A1FE|nr:hypothetical protein [Novosphingobium sp. KN65.2]